MFYFFQDAFGNFSCLGAERSAVMIVPSTPEIVPGSLMNIRHRNNAQTIARIILSPNCL